VGKSANTLIDGAGYDPQGNYDDMIDLSGVPYFSSPT
jgi:hypothetical protein